MNKLERVELQRLKEMRSSVMYDPSTCPVVSKVADLLINLPYSTEFFYQIAHLRKTLFSIGSNYVEGKAKGSLKEMIKFDNIAKGSLYEAKAQYILCGLEIPETINELQDIINGELFASIDRREEQIRGKLIGVVGDGDDQKTPP